MVDPYHPKQADFVFTEEEKKAVMAALAQDKPWNHSAAPLATYSKVLRTLKDRLREHHLKRHGNTCCYCRNILHGSGPFMLDREHILPKHEFREYSYDIGNLSVACKRCNIQFKGKLLDFLRVEPKSIKALPTDCEVFHFIHPNLDLWEEHITRYAQQVGKFYVVAYKVNPNSIKGQWTFDFFGLDDLEVDSFDAAQGARGLSDSEDEVMRKFRDLVKAP
jgi:hypothetical protein